ncbi:MAG: phosphoribosyltransferase domain-containing protein [Methylococcales bacterium]
MPKIVSITLATGVLHLDLIPGRIPLHRLLGFAARISSKRKFLFVSKILGKHYPVSPLVMRWSYRALARMVLKNLSQQGSLWVGMAETATGLGYGVFEAACREGLDKGLFMQTTRYHLDDIEKLGFEEAHSHATDFFLYYPERESYRKRFLTAETLVLIDDEISTGKTFLRLIKTYQAVNPHLQKVYIVSLVNFAHLHDRKVLETEAGVAIEWIAFRSGQIQFDDNQNAELANIVVNVSSNDACKKALLAWPGRLGMSAPINLGEDTVPNVIQLFKEKLDSRPLLVLGTGECNALGFMLGRALERAGYKVKVQSTTRSPIQSGNDITSVCQFTDNYQDNIPNFIYNLNPADYREIIVCHETPLCPALIERLDAWQAISAQLQVVGRLSDESSEPYAKLHFFRP